MIAAMVTVADFRKWLEQFPEDTEVLVAFQQKASQYQSFGEVKFEEPELSGRNIGKGWEYTDFNGNKFVSPDAPHLGRKFLYIGERY